MTQPLHIRTLEQQDLPFADSLRALVGWNQTFTDWRRFLAMQPGGCFLAEWDGVPVGTATTLVYGPDLAWIGMVLVHPQYRRRGIGRALLVHCIAFLQQLGVRCIKLDATPAGKEVYVQLGFRDEWPLQRWEHSGLQLEPPGDARCRPWRAADAGLAVPLDLAAFGVSRETLLQALAHDSRCALTWASSGTGQFEGYGMTRSGTRASYLGPIAATATDAGLQLVRSLLAECRGEKVFWDVPDANLPAVTWAREHGFTPQRALYRMYLGKNTAPGNPCLQFALAGPEVG